MTFSLIAAFRNPTGDRIGAFGTAKGVSAPAPP
jgi:hypothetical protein